MQEEAGTVSLKDVINNKNMILYIMKNNMKLFVYVILLGFSTHAYAQIAIGKTLISNSSVLLEFGAGNKGIILPAVTSTPMNSGGTFIFNTLTNSVQVWEQRTNSGTGGWLNLTAINEGVSHSFSNSSPENTISRGVIIGSRTTTKTGNLVLESTSRALVLPIVQNPHLTMVGSVAGTMVYDANSSTLAVYDGVNWNYWK